MRFWVVASVLGVTSLAMVACARDGDIDGEGEGEGEGGVGESGEGEGEGGDGEGEAEFNFHSQQDIQKFAAVSHPEPRDFALFQGIDVVDLAPLSGVFFWVQVLGITQTALTTTAPLDSIRVDEQVALVENLALRDVILPSIDTPQYLLTIDNCPNVERVILQLVPSLDDIAIFPNSSDNLCELDLGIANGGFCVRLPELQSALCGGNAIITTGCP